MTPIRSQEPLTAPSPNALPLRAVHLSAVSHPLLTPVFSILPEKVSIPPMIHNPLTPRSHSSRWKAWERVKLLKNTLYFIKKNFWVQYISPSLLITTRLCCLQQEITQSTMLTSMIFQVIWSIKTHFISIVQKPNWFHRCSEVHIRRPSSVSHSELWPCGAYSNWDSQLIVS